MGSSQLAHSKGLKEIFYLGIATHDNTTCSRSIIMRRILEEQTKNDVVILIYRGVLQVHTAAVVIALFESVMSCVSARRS